MARGILHISRAFALSVLVLVAASCGGDASTGVPVRATPDSLLVSGLGNGSSATLLQCDPPDTAQSATAIIGPLGGTVAIGNTIVAIPANAVLAPTSFRLSIPASRLVEISVQAGDSLHFYFLKPVLVTIDYGRCADAVPPQSSLSVWHIDETSKSLLELMPSVDLRLLHTISFYTGHLSGYAVAD